MTDLNESAFERIAAETIDELFDVLEDSLEDVMGERADVELQQGILTIDVEGTGRWVINKHAVNRQIWVSSPVSGAAHFDWDGSSEWIGTRGEGSLRARLAAELSAAAGAPVELA